MAAGRAKDSLAHVASTAPHKTTVTRGGCHMIRAAMFRVRPALAGRASSRENRQCRRRRGAHWPTCWRRGTLTRGSERRPGLPSYKSGRRKRRSKIIRSRFFGDLPPYCPVIEGRHHAPLWTPQPLSARIFDELDAALSNDGNCLTQEVHASKGWADIHFMTVYTAIARRDAAPDLERTIRSVVIPLLVIAHLTSLATTRSRPREGFTRRNRSGLAWHRSPMSLGRLNQCRRNHPAAPLMRGRLRRRHRPLGLH